MVDLAIHGLLACRCYPLSSNWKSMCYCSCLSQICLFSSLATVESANILGSALSFSIQFGATLGTIGRARDHLSHDSWPSRLPAVLRALRDGPLWI